MSGARLWARHPPQILPATAKFGCESVPPKMTATARAGRWARCRQTRGRCGIRDYDITSIPLRQRRFPAWLASPGSGHSGTRRGALLGLGADGGSSVSPEDGTRRPSAILACAQRRDVRPNIWASLRSESELPASTLSRYAATAASSTAAASGTYRLVALLAGRDGRRPGDLRLRLPVLVWCIPLGTAGELGASRRPVFCCPGCADEPDKELIGAHKTDRRPGATTAPTRPWG